MKRVIIGLVLAGAAFSAGAETKVLKVGKMHCADCAAQVKEKLCGTGEYQTCEVKILSEKKELGQVKLVSKGDQKIDMAKVAKIIEDEGYELKTK